ncbi:MAG: AmmeMemoRadiSam system protein A [Chlorobi bacterium]|nr:AmmeMemoRadiSam system protein A [Chlorobiota bacterium]
MVTLTEDEKRALISIARNAIQDTLEGRRLPPSLENLPEALKVPARTFVTINEREGDLRGCMGTLTPLPLALSVYESAINAAFHDPRFPPLTLPELDNVKLHISILSDFIPLEYTGLDDLINKLKSKPGLLLVHPLGRSLLLPSVWEKIPDPYQFLLALANKAGFGPDIYADPRTKLFYFTTEEIAEE